MRESKFPIVLIIVLVMVLIAIIIFAVSFLGGKKGGNNTGKTGEQEAIIPVLELSLDNNEADQESVKIIAVATTEDKDGIKYIELPDGTQIFADKAEYTATENKKYEFKVVGNNEARTKLAIEVKNIRKISSKNPYIPDGFEHVEGEVDEGYVIKDKYNNEYVWVPVETGILTRTTRGDANYEDSNSSATGLVNSVAKNYGFYIARYEASAYQANGTKFAASLKSQKPWTNVAYHEAFRAAENTSVLLQYPEDMVTAIASSYAWDTTLEWIDKSITNYSTNTSYGNYSGTILPAGETASDKIKNICDLAGNVREWTTEIYKENGENTNDEYNDEYYDESDSSNKGKENYVNRVVRGGSAYINKVANSRNGYPENLVDEYWGFRTVLYKKS